MQTLEIVGCSASLRWGRWQNYACVMRAGGRWASGRLVPLQGVAFWASRWKNVLFAGTGICIENKHKEVGMGDQSRFGVFLLECVGQISQNQCFLCGGLS